MSLDDALEVLSSGSEGAKDAVQRLLAENASLREELLRQWARNHYDICGDHCNGIACEWPKPKILEGK